MSTVLSIDYGSVRVGLAVSDEEKKFALALKTVPSEPRNECYDLIKRVAEDNAVERIIVGLPLSLGGDEGMQAQEARSFGNELANIAGIPVEFADERFSTKEAAFAAKMKGEKYPDAEAARIILEAWLMKNMTRGSE